MNYRYVLDSWALLALLQAEEPAANRVRQILHDASANDDLVAISVINLGEIFYIIGRRHGEPAARQTMNTIKAAMLYILPATESMVFAAARYKMQHPIAYADAFAVAAAAQLDATLVTGDPEIIAVADVIPVEALQRNK